MWTTYAMAMYGGFPPPVPRPEFKAPPSSSKPVTAPTSPKSGPLSTEMSPMSGTDYFEAAIERPPSPGRLRQLNAEMKRASHLRRQNGHRTAASASSSMTSLSGEYPGWEQALESLSIVRRSSIRSIDSGAPSRERAESVYGFGKNMFNRRGRSKRESSANSSSASSLYSTDSPIDKEALMPTLFSRRKASRDDSSRGKIQISSPFNFQHVTHTDRDNGSAKRFTHIPEQAPDVLTLPATGPAPTSAPIMSFPTDSRGFPFTTDMSAELPTSAVRPPLIPRHTAPASAPRRLMRRIRSQDQLRDTPSSPPPRPPRSPTYISTSPSFTPVPPPRGSSRQGSYQEAGDPFTAASIERPKTSGGFRYPQPFSPSKTTDRPQLTMPVYRPSTPTNGDSDFHISRISPVQPSPTDDSWPLANSSLTTYETPLPDVPEEEEHNAARRSQMSIASNPSLRASQSVPMLRSVSKSKRPMSGASETLGEAHAPVVQRAILEEKQDAFHFGTAEENWEDDIDYCYEHEAEADCDYEWERCSMDTARMEDPPDSPTLPAAVSLAVDQVPIGTAQSSPGLLSVSGFDVPALSPVSQVSVAMGHEALTPTSQALANNFSLPLSDRKHLRASHASSFKESHGFTLSPSLLIPKDFHHQMLLEEDVQRAYPEEDDLVVPYPPQDAYYEAGKPVHWSQQRSSTSTMATNSTRSDSTGDRHTSANSSWSFMTRHTASSTSLNKMLASEPLPTHVVEEVQHETEQDAVHAISYDTVPELFPIPAVPSRRPSHHKTHASESVIHEREDALPSMKTFESRESRRSRARAASLSSQVPPVGQYALFPRSYIKPIGDKI